MLNKGRLSRLAYCYSVKLMRGVSYIKAMLKVLGSILVVIKASVWQNFSG